MWHKALAVTVVAWALAGAAWAEPPVAGAIRWDGWWAGNPYSEHLAGEAFRGRVPFYGVTADGKLSVVSDDQGVMDREIDYAHEAGLGYWAFCWYHPESFEGADRYNYGIRRYLASAKRGELHFCLLLQGQHLGKAEHWDETVGRLASLMREPGYQQVAGGRPLVYLFYVDSLAQTFGGEAAARAALDRLRGAAVAAGAGRPYLVAQVFSAEAGKAAVERLGFDAMSAYAMQPGGPAEEATHAKLAECNLGFDESLRQTGREVIPILTTGWDDRPRWAEGTHGAKPGAYFTTARPEELRQDVAKTARWVRQHPEACAANTLLIYAWNESDEGGWLVPTAADRTKRIEAVRAGLREAEGSR